MRAPLADRDTRAVELLLAHCAALSQAADPRKPVFDRLRELIGVELTRLLLVALAEPQRVRPVRRPS
ncbi:MAG TPA: hypothetical protein VE753_09325 [Gaiellaceae bacterium]|nr:hypothetical protein [Gaiellaceae bacterium]